MKNNLILLSLITVLLISCSDKNEEESVDSNVITNVAVMPGADTDSGPLPSLAYSLDANINFYNFTLNDEQKMEKAIEIIKLVVATEEFRSRVLNHTYNGEKTFVDNKGLTNSQIYQMILDGAERLYPYKNNAMDAQVELYLDNTNIVGYTYANTTRIWVNRKYFDTYTSAGVAHNLFHEWMHKLGFEHATVWSPSRDYSVPYSLGYLIGEIGQDFL